MPKKINSSDKAAHSKRSFIFDKEGQVFDCETFLRQIISEKLGFRIRFMEDGSTKIYSLEKERELVLKKYMKEIRGKE